MEATIRVRTVIGFAGVVVAAVLASIVVLQAWQADAAPGDDDATFVPVTPCRLFDVRPEFQVGSKASPLGPGEVHTLSVHGNNGNCAGIPSSATAVSLNVTALDATAPTFLTLWPTGVERPDASSLNPVPGQPPVPNAVTVALSSNGQFDAFNLAGSVNVLADVNGYYVPSSLQNLDNRLVALEAQVADLAAENAVLKAKTAAMSVVTVDAQPTVRFSNVNVQVVDGSGDTHGAVNGRGNLIVGYQESGSDTRTGSHNLVVGPFHSYTSFGGLIAGYNNTTTGAYASVSGGIGNTASGSSSSVSGGNNNTANGGVASVSGGDNNTASGFYSSVSGGNSRSAIGTHDWRAGTLFEGN